MNWNFQTWNFLESVGAFSLVVGALLVVLVLYWFVRYYLLDHIRTWARTIIRNTHDRFNRTIAQNMVKSIDLDRADVKIKLKRLLQLLNKIKFTKYMRNGLCEQWNTIPYSPLYCARCKYGKYCEKERLWRKLKEQVEKYLDDGDFVYFQSIKWTIKNLVNK